MIKKTGVVVMMRPGETLPSYIYSRTEVWQDDIP